MLLRDYLAREGHTYSAFASLIGSNHARTVERYAKGRQIPDKTMMLRIVDATSGEVTPNDFFGIDAPAEEAADLPEAVLEGGDDLMGRSNTPADIGPSATNGGQLIRGEAEAESHRPFSLTSFRTTPLDGAADPGPCPSSTGASLEADAA